MGEHTNRTALAVSIPSWFVITSVLIVILDGVGMPTYVEETTTRFEFYGHGFRERVVDGYGTGVAELCIVLGVVLSRIVYKLIDRQTPMSRQEKRWLTYIGVGYAVWTLSGEWLDAPDTLELYILRNLLHLAIGAGIIGLCRWDYVRTFRPS